MEYAGEVRAHQRLEEIGVKIANSSAELGGIYYLT
jgi:hypothetical protein